MFKLLPLPPGCKLSKAVLWTQLTTSPYFVATREEGHYLPKIKTDNPLAILYKGGLSDGEHDPLPYPEEYDVDNFIASFHAADVRDANLALLRGLLEELAPARGASSTSGTLSHPVKRGRPKKVTAPGAVPVPQESTGQPREDDVKKIQDFCNTLAFWRNRIKEETGESTSAEGAPHPTKRRRLSKKITPADLPASQAAGQPGSQAATQPASQGIRSRPRRLIQSVIAYGRQRWDRGRRTPDQKAAQTMHQIFQEALIPHSEDLDFANCAFSLLPQMLRRLGICETKWAKQFALLDKLSTKRDDIIDKALRLPHSVGKQLLLETSRGKRLPKDFQSNTLLKSIHRLSLWLRMVAVSVITETYVSLVFEGNL